MLRFYFEPNVEEKAELFTAEKEAIARYAASLIEDGDFVYIDFVSNPFSFSKLRSLRIVDSEVLNSPQSSLSPTLFLGRRPKESYSSFRQNLSHLSQMLS